MKGRAIGRGGEKEEQMEGGEERRAVGPDY